ncbi:MAG: hypothetical protein HY074_09410 [Deltaproteobacteria bacterium]|nr:hypothetical protein [Deltaproteobacteria bacterium]
MKNFATIIALFSLTTAAAHAADLVRFTTNADGNKVVQLHSVGAGVSADLYNVFDKAGFQRQQHVEGRRVFGRNIESSVMFLNGANYNTSLTINDQTQVHVERNARGTFISLRGELARDMLEAMQKAGANRPGRGRAGIEEYGTNLAFCTLVGVVGSEQNRHLTCEIVVNAR